LPLDGSFEPEIVASRAGLVYVDDDDPGIRRLSVGDGFSYLDPDGTPVTDPETLDRIRALAVPPAYSDVWISTDPLGHIQATARDARGRKQYRYHARWRASRDEGKFGRMAAFGRALPKIRAAVDADLARPGLPHDKVTALVVRLLELTLIRVGNDEYARSNKHFGLTTLRSRHARVNGSEVRFEFKGKSGVNHSTGLTDRRLARVIKAVHDLPGQRLFQYLGADGQRRPIGSADVNAYLEAVTGRHFTAKDFRTWAGTLAAAKALALQPRPASQAEAKRALNLSIKATAGLLGNTPSVCRKAYVHPEVLKAFSDQALPASFAKADGEVLERAVLRFLDKLAKRADAARRNRILGPRPCGRPHLA
jgi:DNA topoisomerase-1